MKYPFDRIGKCRNRFWEGNSSVKRNGSVKRDGSVKKTVLQRKTVLENETVCTDQVAPIASPPSILKQWPDSNIDTTISNIANKKKY